MLVVLPATVGSAQETTPTASSSPAPTVSSATPATAADVAALRQQVQSLTETVKALQQEVKDQQATLEKANLAGESGLPQNPEPSPIAGAERSPTPSGSAAPQFPTEDTSVVSSTTASAALPAARHEPRLIAGQFPDDRHLGCNIGTGNDLKHGCWGVVNATYYYWWQQSLHEHLTRQCLRVSLFQRSQSP